MALGTHLEGQLHALTSFLDLEGHHYYCHLCLWQYLWTYPSISMLVMKLVFATYLLCSYFLLSQGILCKGAWVPKRCSFSCAHTFTHPPQVTQIHTQFPTKTSFKISYVWVTTGIFTKYRCTIPASSFHLGCCCLFLWSGHFWGLSNWSDIFVYHFLLY